MSDPAPSRDGAMTLRFDGRVAIVTGAGTGIGRIYALQLAERGAKVVVNDLGGSVAGQGRSRQAADAVVDEIRAAGGEAVASHDSVATPEGAGRIVATAVEHFGRLDVLVNNAGNLKMAKLGEAPVGDVDAQVGVHLMGTLYCCRAALPEMQRHGYGRIVLTSSGSGLVGFAGQAAYGAAKTGMVGLMNCISREYGEQGIFINTIVPTATTRMSQGLLWPQMEKFLRPELVAPAVLFLASERCTSNSGMFAVAGGHVAKLEVHKAPGVQFDPTKPVTPEMVAARFDTVCDMAGAAEFRGTQAAMEKMLTQMGVM
ncbi:SDR family oxidoreductase [Variovorax defluvii]|uniref:SDR family oxidoreductase n=1 Tax=Variovorax defluvii TaxID=913761 RepID=A0ABP8HTJ4_9BURK